jgi:hypothetical protein
MYLTLLKRFLYAGLTIVVVSAQLSYAEITPNETESSLNQFLITDNKGTELQLQVRKMPLTKVITDISKKTNTPIHYSVLPKGLVSATCVASSIKKILECLLNHKADLIVRYGRPDKPNGKEQLVEAWILGSRIDGSTVADCNMTTISTNSTSLSFSQDNKKSNDVPDQTENLLQDAQSKDPIKRAESIGLLLAGGRAGDPAVKLALENALTDQDDNVRAQAISSLAHREGAGAVAAIQEALHDKSIDVRVMAVDGIVNDKALLEQAANDSDEIVKSLAIEKLKALNQSN